MARNRLNEGMTVYHGSFQNLQTFLDENGNPYDLIESEFKNKKSNDDPNTSGGGRGDASDIESTGNGEGQESEGQQGTPQGQSKQSQSSQSGEDNSSEEGEQEGSEQGNSNQGDSQSDSNENGKGEGEDEESESSQGNQGNSDSGGGNNSDLDNDEEQEQEQSEPQYIEPEVGQKFKDIRTNQVYVWDGKKFKRTK